MIYQEEIKVGRKDKNLKITDEQRTKCHAVIHSASVAAGGAGAAGAQLPVADNAVIVPIQISMIIGLGKIFDLQITKAVASGIIKSAAASFVGRGISQVLFGWIPGAGNAINTATAAGLTEAIGWIAVKEFSEKSEKYKGKDAQNKKQEEEQEEEKKEKQESADNKNQNEQVEAETNRNKDASEEDIDVRKYFKGN